MRFRSVLTTLVMAATVAVAGCAPMAPIMNIDDAGVLTPSGRALSREQVRSAIARAGASLGWQLKDEGPNMVVGTLYIRAHMATVEIPYSSQSYSIRYRSSANLKEQGGMIHRRYNDWIQNLTRNINAQLAAS